MVHAGASRFELAARAAGTIRPAICVGVARARGTFVVVVQAEVDVGAQSKVTDFQPGTPSAVSVVAYAHDVEENDRGYLLFVSLLSLSHLMPLVVARKAEPGSRLPIDPASAPAGTLSTSLRRY